MHTRRMPLRTVRGRAHRDLVERAVVQGKAGRIDAGHADALDHRPVEASRPVCADGASKPGGAGTEIEARHVHGGRRGLNGPHASGARQVCELAGIEGGGNRCRLLVDDRRASLDDHAVLERCDRQFGINGRREAKADVNSFAPECLEPVQREYQRVLARRKCWKPIEPLAVRYCCPRTHERGTGDDDRDNGQNCARAVCDGAVDGAGHGAHRLTSRLGTAGPGGCFGEPGRSKAGSGGRRCVQREAGQEPGNEDSPPIPFGSVLTVERGFEPAHCLTSGFSRGGSRLHQPPPAASQVRPIIARRSRSRPCGSHLLCTIPAGLARSTPPRKRTTPRGSLPLREAP